MMNQSRLSLALDADLFVLPDGPIAVFGAGADTDLSALPKDRVLVICGTKPGYDILEQAGYSVSIGAPEHAELSIVILPRARAEARMMIAQAAEISRGSVLIDGQKTDGIDSVYKEMRKRGTASPAYSKAHGKLFSVDDIGDNVADWTVGRPTQNRDGFAVAPGVFSADGIDPASRLLADALPEKLGANVADLGAGWGYLSRRILEREAVKSLELVEANHAAIECAKINVTDARAEFYWADATTWSPRSRLDTVVMNPPFHMGRKGMPDLGRAFIHRAAACLAQSGVLWMVANRHLPYETALADNFKQVEEISGDNRFKILRASRPSRQAR